MKNRMLCKPTWNNGTVIVGGQDELHIKCICLVAGYAKQFGCNTHDRPAIMEYEVLDEEIV